MAIRLDADLLRRPDAICSRADQTRSEIMCEALHRHLASMQFEQLREGVMPLAEAQGCLTDVDVFRAVS